MTILIGWSSLYSPPQIETHPQCHLLHEAFQSHPSLVRIQLFLGRPLFIKIPISALIIVCIITLNYGWVCVFLTSSLD